MESTKESIRVGLVQRAVAFGLAVAATTLLFTSVPVIATATAGVAPTVQALHGI
jgi:hypothetical protein